MLTNVMPPNNKKDESWTFRTIVLVLISVLGFFCAWAFTEIAEMPEKYVVKKDMQCIVDRLNTRFDRLDRKIDDVNNYLRDK